MDLPSILGSLPGVDMNDPKIQDMFKKDKKEDDSK